MYRIGGRLRTLGASLGGATLGIPPFQCWDSNQNRDPVLEQCQVGSLTGAVASERVTEAPKGSLSAVGNRAYRV